MSTDRTAPAPTTEEAAAAAEWAAALAEAERAVAEQEAAERAGVVPPPAVVRAPEPPPAPPRPRRALKAALVLGSLLGGLAAGFAFDNHPVAPPEALSPEHPDESTGHHAPGTAHEPPPGIDGIDLLIRTAAFDEALKLCRDLPGPSADERGIDYREGLCLEGLGRWKEAREAYRKAAGPDTDAAWARAVLGEARCAVALDDIAAARKLLDEVTRRADDPACRRGHIPEECLWLRARLEVLALGDRPPIDPFDPNASAWPALGGAIDRYLDWLPAAAAHADHGRHPEPDTHAAGFVRRVVTDVLIARAEHAHGDSHHGKPAAALTRVLLAAPDHPLAAAARVALVNLDFEAGRLRDAARGYRHFLETNPHAAEAVCAAYNLGLVELRAGNLAASRARFLEAVDRAPATKWADYGWWWIGRTYLETGDSEAARKPFETARGGTTKAVASAAGLAVCACDLLEGDDDAARALLREHRVVNRDDHIALEEMFDAVLRYRAAPSESRGETLLAALTDADNGNPLGPVGVLLAGRAYRELGMYDRAAAVFDAGAEKYRGPLALRMLFEAAGRYDELDLRKEARSRYLAVWAVDPQGLGAKAELRLADLAARDGRGEECVRRCRGLVGNPAVDQRELLAVLGRGYELERRYGLAAQCFAGVVPEE